MYMYICIYIYIYVCMNIICIRTCSVPESRFTSGVEVTLWTSTRKMPRSRIPRMRMGHTNDAARMFHTFSVRVYDLGGFSRILFVYSYTSANQKLRTHKPQPR